jgi:hemerythrin-like metal-binding protein
VGCVPGDGRPVIDAQHREIFDLLSSLETAGAQSPSDAFFVAGRLMEHVDVHFAMEEDLMRRSEYPGAKIDRHVQEHDDLRQKARDAVVGFRVQPSGSTAGMVEFLRSWLWSHIECEDRQLVAHLREPGDVRPGPE